MPVVAEHGGDIECIIARLIGDFELENLEQPPLLAWEQFDRPIPKYLKRALNTVLCQITGDIDLVYGTGLFGASLTPQKMLEVFSALEAARFAHTDLATWVEKQTGKFYIPGKERQLKGLTMGQEATVQFAPERIARATCLAPLDQSISTGPNSYQLTIIDEKNPPIK